MTINYYGQIKGEKHNTRVAAIEWKEGNEKDENLAERIVDLMLKTTAWNRVSGFDQMVMVDMEDRQDFEEFVKFYKEAKRMFQNCMKYGF